MTAAPTSSNTCAKNYGNDSVAQIVTFGTMGAKSVVRDVGRVMGLGYSDCDRLAKMIPTDFEDGSREGGFKRASAGKAQDGLRLPEEVTRELFETAFILEES